MNPQMHTPNAGEPSEGKRPPGYNPNRANAKPRGIRPKTKNSSGGNVGQSMRLNWIDPLPQVNTIYPLGLEPNPETIPAGEVDLEFELPTTIAQPFASVINSVGARIQMSEEDMEQSSEALLAMSYFKSARQLFSTMQDNEKSECQPLKAIYYDETPIPLHMSGAIGIIGHMETKIGTVLVRDAQVLFKRWIAQGLVIGNRRVIEGDCSNLIWRGRSDLSCVQRLAREKIDSLTNFSYTINVGTETLTVSMPKLRDQNLEDYFDMINDRVPQAIALRRCVAALEMTYGQFRTGIGIPHDVTLLQIFNTLDLVDGTDEFDISILRDDFEEFMSRYITDIKWRIESIFNTGPPPAGTTGYGAQTVTASGTNVAKWQFPLSDADVNLGFLFSPAKSFTLHPKLVGYSKRSRATASASFAQQDGKAFTK